MKQNILIAFVILCCLLLISCGQGVNSGSAIPGSSTSTTIGSPTSTTLTSGTTTTTLPSHSVSGFDPNLTAQAASSSKIYLTWTASSNATSTLIYLGAEPAASPSAQLPGEILAATLAGNANSYQLNNLAPAVDTFIRVEEVTPAKRISTFAHARTIGGPRKNLDSYVREVHGYAPDVLEIILASGEGTAWQAGPWMVNRSNGSAITVNNVYRHSYAVQMPAYSLGYDINYSDAIVYADHQIFLQLNQAIGTLEVLTVTGPNGVNFVLPFSDRYLETPVVDVNQVGYNPRATHRYAYVYGWMGDGGELSLSNFPSQAEALIEPADPLTPRTVAVSGLNLQTRASSDSDQVGSCKEISLSGLQPAESVIYRIRIPGVGISWKTAVSEIAAYRAFYVVTRGLLFNRWSGDLRSDLTNWSRPQDNQRPVSDGTQADYEQGPYSFKISPTQSRTVLHGYHDAGDFDQRPMHTVVPQLLMRAYELNPSLYSGNQLNLPESGNGIPDILNEALWGISGWEQFQGPDGGIRQGCDAANQPKGYYHANNDPLDYVTYAEDASISARVAGLFAQASRLVAPFAPDRAATLSLEAIQAYNYAKANTAPNGFLMYGAGELFRLTGDPAYDTDFQTYWGLIGPYGGFSNFAPYELLMGDYHQNPKPQIMPDFFLGYYGSPNAQASIKNLIDSQLPGYVEGPAAEPVNNVLNSIHAFRNPRPNADQINWGFATSVNRYLDPALGLIQTGNLSSSQKQDIFDALSLCADYVLGCNPNSFVYISGLGTRHPEEPLHLDSLAFVKESQGKPMPGIPVYGPVEQDGLGHPSYINSALAVYYPDFNTGTPKLLRYGDVRVFVNDNEFSVWEMQGPLAQMFSVLIAPGMTASSLPATEGIDHAQE